MERLKPTLRTGGVGCLVAGVFLLAGCGGVHDVVPYARVAFESAREPGVVLALRSSCTEVSASASNVVGGGRPSCDFDRENAVDEIVRVTLEFAGHQVVDSERINPTATTKDKVWNYTEREDETTERTLVMDDLSPTLRRALVELGVEGVLNTAVVGGPVRRGMGVEWIEVQLQMSRMDSGAPVWRSHCRALVLEGNRFVRPLARALEAATTCAIEAPRVLRRRDARTVSP